MAAWRVDGLRVALVPTMGALHQGHLSLVSLAKAAADRVVASLFVNPAQFAPGEDFEAYPRDEAADAAKLRRAGCDLLYAPTPEMIYPFGFSTTVIVSGVSAELEGAARPTHFAGVATVVTKLLIQCGPDTAVFGEKDYQQLQVIRSLVTDLDLPVHVLGAPIIREGDGLAMSSRNAYLTPGERAIAPALNAALRQAAICLNTAVPIADIEREGHETILAAGFDSVDYFEVREAASLARPDPSSRDKPLRILAAARLGRTRLLDNVAV